MLQVGGLTVDYQLLLYKRHCEWFSEPIAQLPFGERIPCTNLQLPRYENNPGAVDALASTIADAIKPQLQELLLLSRCSFELVRDEASTADSLYSSSGEEHFMSVAEMFGYQTQDGEICN